MLSISFSQFRLYTIEVAPELCGLDSYNDVELPLGGGCSPETVEIWEAEPVGKDAPETDMTVSLDMLPQLVTLPLLLPRTVEIVSWPSDPLPRTLALSSKFKSGLEPWVNRFGCSCI